MEDIQKLKEIQDMEFLAFEQIKRICYQNNITFYMRGGSVLGAVKYQGFVPWDDDIDIALPRKDYLKLIEIMPQYFGENFQFISYQKVKNAHCYFPRVVLTKEFCEKAGLPQNNERGLVLIDVLPLDGMPDNRFVRSIHILKAYICRCLASLWTLDVKNTVSMHKEGHQKILKVLHALKIHRLYKQDTIYKYLDEMYARYDFRTTKYSGMLSSSKLSKEIVKSEWWGEGAEKCFREIMVKVPSNYDGYLEKLFGDNYADYEPPEEERKKSHLRGVARNK